jgi:hypothetical protein
MYFYFLYIQYMPISFYLYTELLPHFYCLISLDICVCKGTVSPVWGRVFQRNFFLWLEEKWKQNSFRYFRKFHIFRNFGFREKVIFTKQNEKTMTQKVQWNETGENNRQNDVSYANCQPLLCLATCPLWCCYLSNVFPTCMMLAYLYEACLLVWCLPTCMKSAYLLSVMLST